MNFLDVPFLHVTPPVLPCFLSHSSAILSIKPDRAKKIHIKKIYIWLFLSNVLSTSPVKDSHQGAATVKVTVESDSEGEEDEEEEEVVVEVEQRPPTLQLQDRVTGRQFENLQVSHNTLVLNPDRDKHFC